MKTAHQILEYLDETLGVSRDTMSEEDFRFSDIQDNIKDSLIRWVLESLDRSDSNMSPLLWETIPGASEHPCVVYQYLAHPLQYMRCLRNYLISEEPETILVTEATLAKGYNLDHMCGLLVSDQWKFYGDIAYAVNSYIQKIIEEKVDSNLSAYLNTFDQAIAC